MLECVQDVVLQELLVRDPHLHRLPGRAVLSVPDSQGGGSCEFSACPKLEQSHRWRAQVRPRLEARNRAAAKGLRVEREQIGSPQLCLPVLDQRNVEGSPGAARAQVKGPRCPEQGDAIGRVVRVKRGLFEEGLHKLWQLKLLVVLRERLLALGGSEWSQRPPREPTSLRKGPVGSPREPEEPRTKNHLALQTSLRTVEQKPPTGQKVPCNPSSFRQPLSRSSECYQNEHFPLFVCFSPSRRLFYRSNYSLKSLLLVCFTLISIWKTLQVPSRDGSRQKQKCRLFLTQHTHTHPTWSHLN